MPSKGYEKEVIHKNSSSKQVLLLLSLLECLLLCLQCLHVPISSTTFLYLETFLETIFLGMDYFSSKNFEIVTGSAASLKLVVGNRISQVHIRNFFSKCNFFGVMISCFCRKTCGEVFANKISLAKGRRFYNIKITLGTLPIKGSETLNFIDIGTDNGL